MIDQSDCNHPNATVELLEYSMPSLDSDSNRYANDDSEELLTLVCPDCGFEQIQEPDHA